MTKWVLRPILILLKRIFRNFEGWVFFVWYCSTLGFWVNWMWLTGQKLRTHAWKLVAVSRPSSLQQIPKLGNTWSSLPWALNSWFIISDSLCFQTFPYLSSLYDVILCSFCSVDVIENGGRLEAEVIKFCFLFVVCLLFFLFMCLCIQ